MRITQANGLDLARFHFDFDLSFAALLMNADGTVYGRFGSRSATGADKDSDISLAGLQATLAAALTLHQNAQANRTALAAKAPPEPRYPTPEQIPSLTRYEPAITYGEGVAKSCIHCHSVRDATRRLDRDAGHTFTDTQIFPWPMPETVGFHVDPDGLPTVDHVDPGSPAATAGIQPGDRITSFAGTPVIATADIQYALERTPGDNPSTLPVHLERDGQTVPTSITLEPGWRQHSDISWRVSTWDLRRMVLGGMRLLPVPASDHARLGIDPDKDLALVAVNVGQYGEHAVAHRAGVKKEDVVVALGDAPPGLTESQLIAHLLKNHPKGSKIPLTVLRDGERITTSILMQ